MSEVEFKKFAICDTCGVETLCREYGADDQCGTCYRPPINEAKHQSELAALRDKVTKRLTAAEQRDAELVELLKEAYDCGDSYVFGAGLDERIAVALKLTESGESE